MSYCRIVGDLRGNWSKTPDRRGQDDFAGCLHTKSHAFKSTLKVVPPPVPPRNRSEHGKSLLGQVKKLAETAKALNQARREAGLPDASGMTVALEIFPRGSVDYFKQLEWKRSSIEVLSASDAGGSEIVVLYVPDGKLSAFEERIKSYLEKDTQPKKDGDPLKPKHAALINAISSFRKAAFQELWTDEAEPPRDTIPAWFQVWLREGSVGAKATRAAFVEAASSFDVIVEPGFVRFPGRVVVAVQSTRKILEQTLDLLDQVAEIRSVKPTAEFFVAKLAPFEQADWAKNLLERMSCEATDKGPYVTVLDTGANSGHPLLRPLLHESDQHAVDFVWGTSDHDGHGSEMAGLSAFGDLVTPLSSIGPVSIPHRLETVKILPPDGANSPHLYGWVMAQAAGKVEAVPGRLRTFAMMTTCEGHNTGLPSEWSAAIDAMALGLDISGEEDSEKTPRLFTLAAGNVHWTKWTEYPAVNYATPIEDPGQSWNALTVGACTHMDEVDKEKWPGHKPIASAGRLSPSSTTSEQWGSAWPFKPDVVAEGGNGSVDSGYPGAVVGPSSLRLLTTAHDFTKSLFADAGDTSGAAAEVARLSAHLQARYPGFWPETLRALVVHGATYTAAMRAEMPEHLVKQDKIRLLRRYGQGRVNFERSLDSASKRATLVLQETIVPYEKGEAGSGIKLGRLNMHALPWPAEELQKFGEAMVNMRVTLSYFVEPNPSRRGWRSKFRYQSHGLRFAVQGSTENADRFMLRINKLTREEIEEANEADALVDKSEKITDPDTAHWTLGAQLRNRGSLHCDTWRGTASQLAQKSHIAIFPVGGWWKDCGLEVAATQTARYSLVVSLEVTSEVDIDIYTPIATAIAVVVPVSVPNA